MGGNQAGYLVEHYRSGTGDKDRIAYLSIGVNPKAKLGFNVDHLVSGAVTVAIGNNEVLGGKNKRPFYMRGVLGDATVSVDGREIVKGGKLVI